MFRAESDGLVTFVQVQESRHVPVTLCDNRGVKAATTRQNCAVRETTRCSNCHIQGW